jgi:hypothetical protein
MLKGIIKMLGYQNRVINELNELDKKLDKLSNFLSTETFENLDTQEKHLLLVQHKLMESYAMILELRITTF